MNAWRYVLVLVMISSAAWAQQAGRIRAAGYGDARPGKSVVRRFQKPPKELRLIRIVDKWPKDAAARKELFGSLVARGFGGAAATAQTIGKPEDILTAAHDFDRRGLTLWLIDESGGDGRPPRAIRVAPDAKDAPEPGDAGWCEVKIVGETNMGTITADEIRGECNRLIFSGAGVIACRGSLVGISDEDARGLNDYVARCRSALEVGAKAADIAVFSPSEAVSRVLDMNRRSFVTVDSDSLARVAARNGVLTCGPSRWRAAILPGPVPADLWYKIESFWRTGGIVIALGAPSDAPEPALRVLGEGPGPRIRASDGGGAGVLLTEGSEQLIPALLDALLCNDVIITDPQAPIRSVHHRADLSEVLFMVNDSASAWHGEVRLALGGEGRRLDPTSGSVLPLGPKEGLKMNFGPYDGMLLYFPKNRAPRRIKVTSGSIAGIPIEASTL